MYRRTIADATVSTYGTVIIWWSWVIQGLPTGSVRGIQGIDSQQLQPPAPFKAAAGTI